MITPSSQDSTCTLSDRARSTENDDVIRAEFVGGDPLANAISSSSSSSGDTAIRSTTSKRLILDPLVESMYRDFQTMMIGSSGMAMSTCCGGGCSGRIATRRTKRTPTFFLSVREYRRR